jgi:hypothetical protein
MPYKTLLIITTPLVLLAAAAGGYLVSPFFIRPVLVETMAAPSTILARGAFDQKDAVHKGSGSAILSRTADGKALVTFEDFSVTNGPDLYVYLSGHPNPSNAQELHMQDFNLGRLKAPQGAFSYEIDASVDLDNVKSVVIYCRAFSVVFSSAELRR